MSSGASTWKGVCAHAVAYHLCLNALQAGLPEVGLHKHHVYPRDAIGGKTQILRGIATILNLVPAMDLVNYNNKIFPREVAVMMSCELQLLLFRGKPRP